MSSKERECATTTIIGIWYAMRSEGRSNVLIVLIASADIGVQVRSDNGDDVVGLRVK